MNAEVAQSGIAELDLGLVFRVKARVRVRVRVMIRVRVGDRIIDN